MTVRLLILVCAGALAAAAREDHTVTPIEKVVTLLKKLSSGLEAEGKKEAAEYDKFACFCKEQADEKLYAIETSNKKIDTLKAKQDMLGKNINALNNDITDLTKKVGDLGNDIKTATDKRAADLATYEKKAKDLNDAVSACERAIEALQESKDNIDGKVDLAQLSAASPLLKASLFAQVAQKPASFQYSSNDILATIQTLLAKFKSNKATLDIDEHNDKAAVEMKVQAMSNQKKFAEKEKDEKAADAEQLSEDLAEATEDKTEETKQRDADDEFMKVLTSDCETKATVFDQRSKTRSDEITAITKAVDDLSKNAMDNYKATGLTDLQTKKTSFLQIKGAASRITATQSVLDLLLKKSESSNSPVLSSLSMKLTVMQQSGIDHFVKVRQLIKDLLAKLDADAKSEATTKSYCDKNLKKQTEARDAAELTIEEKAAAIAVAKSDLGATKETIAELQAGIAANMKSMLEASELRAESKATNEESLRMSTEGKKSVEFALSVLKDFYSKAFIQKAAYTPPKAGRDGKTVGDLAPKTSFSGEYHGNQDASKGILGILEVIASDFQRTTDQVTADEKEAQDDYDKDKKATEEDNVAKKKELKVKEKKQSDLEDSIVTFTDDKKAAEANLASAMDVLDDLKKMCIDGEETYAERVAKREEEIEALKQAMEILENWKD